MVDNYNKQIEIESAQTYELHLSELKYITIIKGEHTYFEHLQMLQYVNMIVDDVMVFGKDLKVRFKISITNHIMDLEFDNLYPFINGMVIFIIDLSKIVSIKNIVKTLNHMIDINIDRNEQITYTDLEKRNLFNTIDIVDQALCYDGKLKEVFSKRLLFDESIKFSLFDLQLVENGASEINLISYSAGISIWLNSFRVLFSFDNKDSYHWYFTDDPAFDLESIRHLFKLFLGKKLNKSIIDIKREIQLIEMQII